MFSDSRGPFAAKVPRWSKFLYNCCILGSQKDSLSLNYIWVVVKIMVPFWIPTIIRHLIFRAPKRDHNFDNHPYGTVPFDNLDPYGTLATLRRKARDVARSCFLTKSDNTNNRICRKHRMLKPTISDNIRHSTISKSVILIRGIIRIIVFITLARDL